jgi:hypothetical protein
MTRVPVFKIGMRKMIDYSPLTGTHTFRPVIKNVHAEF